MTWRAAPSVAAALTEATARWPRRNRASDGTVGDAAHQAQPTSDHNPDSRGVVHAFDLTHDPANGVDCARLAQLLVDRRDHRVRYLIWDRRIVLGPWSTSVLAGSAVAWRWARYDGADPHRSHLHVSVGYDDAAETDTGPWWADAPAPAGPTAGEWDAMASQAEVEHAALTGARAALREMFGKAVGPGQRDVAGTIGSTLRTVQGLVNANRQLAAQVGALQAVVGQLAAAHDAVPDPAALLTAATEGAAAALHQLGEKLTDA